MGRGMQLSRKWAFCNSWFHFIILSFYLFFLNTRLHILLQFLQSMHDYLRIWKENILPVRVAKLSPKTHRVLFVYSVSSKRDNVEHQWGIGL